MVANIFEDFESPSKKFLAMPLNIYSISDGCASSNIGYYSTQHSLIWMLGMWQNTLVKGGYAIAMFMNLEKVSDTLNHD